MTSAQPKPHIETHSDLESQPGIPNRPFPLKHVVGSLLAVAAAFIAAALLLPKPANAKDAIGLDAAQQAQVVKIQDYLNAISTMRTRFLQVTSQGQFAQGEFLLERPGRMRIDYDPPVPVLIVSNGLIVMYKDEELDQLSHVPLKTIPASMFIGENVDFFADDLLITDYERAKGAVRVTLQRAADPMDGSLTLVFESEPLALRKWSVLDAQGITTTISLLGPEFGVAFDEQLFRIENRLMGQDKDR